MDIGRANEKRTQFGGVQATVPRTDCAGIWVAIGEVREETSEKRKTTTARQHTALCALFHILELILYRLDSI